MKQYLSLPRHTNRPAVKHLYRPYFRAGIAVALTLGAVWGAWLLLRIAARANFTSVGIHEVNAHGNAQVFGWVGLFVMGFALHMFPRFAGTRLAWPRVALVTLGLMLAGIVLRSGGQALLGVSPGMREAALAGSVFEVLAVLLFAANLLVTRRGSERPLAVWEAYAACALGWFAVQAVYGGVYFAALSGAADREAVLGLVSLWQAPLRDLQIHGFAMLMVLGVSHHVLDRFYHLPRPGVLRSVLVLMLANAAVLGEAAGFVLMRARGHQYVGLWYGSVLVLFVCAAVLVRGWRIFGPYWRADRSVKYVRAAYGWLLVSLGMLVLLPAYQFGLLRALAPESEAARLGFSHAYYGAVRHAVTVGFVSMMILGMAAKFVPVMTGRDARGLPGLWTPFVLLNTGCALRVAFQTLTDFVPWAFPVAGVSGLLEVTALAIWGTHVWRLLGAREAPPCNGAVEAAGG